MSSSIHGTDWTVPGVRDTFRIVSAGIVMHDILSASPCILLLRVVGMSGLGLPTDPLGQSLLSQWLIEFSNGDNTRATPSHHGRFRAGARHKCNSSWNRARYHSTRPMDATSSRTHVPARSARQHAEMQLTKLNSNASGVGGSAAHYLRWLPR